ncbi:MAG TPA: 50S ribosomal protein L21 [Bacteroidales bacterium]|nr:50S ribosomal protein L21 [Bacteroidales bacterium]HOE03744.1 50S ribosomal protein L21 [Bacteroidales bacterium]HQL69675.1 50S ribosomal protein L21 [Bacteroidales bacterium]
MYAIVEIAGQQFKVEKGSKLFVHRLAEAEGSDVDFDRVLLVENDNKFKVGRPVVENAKITAKVLSHMRGDKVLVFKKKRRKGYQILNGHRQDFSEIQIQDIIA